MSGEIEYNFGSLDQAAGQLTAHATKIEGLLDEERQVLTTLDGAWTGAAKEAWQAEQARWQKHADDMNAILHQLASAVTEVTEDMKQVENTNTNHWN
jgi:early secretory antigenic target protein ESAT-6